MGWGPTLIDFSNDIASLIVAKIQDFKLLKQFEILCGIQFPSGKLNSAGWSSPSGLILGKHRALRARCFPKMRKKNRQSKMSEAISYAAYFFLSYVGPQLLDRMLWYVGTPIHQQMRTRLRIKLEIQQPELLFAANGGPEYDKVAGLGSFGSCIPDAASGTRHSILLKNHHLRLILHHLTHFWYNSELSALAPHQVRGPGFSRITPLLGTLYNF